MSRKIAGDERPHYCLATSDFVIIVALNPQGKLLVVRQFRAAVNRFTLELPAGHIEPGETPEEAARKELCEETGCEAGVLELLGKHSPSTARFTNFMWVYFAHNVRPALTPSHPREAGVDSFFYPGSIRSLVDEPEFLAAGACSALFAAAAKGKIVL
ncbi:MAG: NUDIX hydrolase [Verrucomicrobiota bacterium]